MPSKARVEANRWLRLHARQVQGRVLSIGSGDDQDGENGAYRAYFSNCSSYTTSEVTPNSDCDLVLDVQHMPQISDGSYDCVFCSGVLEHVPGFSLALNEISRILRVGGTLLLGVPFRQGIHMPPTDYWRFTEHGVRFILERHGFLLDEIARVDEPGDGDFPAAYWTKSTRLSQVEATCRQHESVSGGWQGAALAAKTAETRRRCELDAATSIRRPDPAVTSSVGPSLSVSSSTPPAEGTVKESFPVNSRVHIVTADEGWILERCSREIESRLQYVTVGREPDPSASINYYVNYSAYQGRTLGHQMALFTHVEEFVPAAAQRFFDVAREMDLCVCMSTPYAARLAQAGIPSDKIVIATPGVDLQSYQPVVRIGVVGRTYATGRKGEDLVARVMDEPGIEWHFTGQGWPGQAKHYEPEQMPSFYNSIDYVLVPAYYEGGPMSVLEALASGKEVIAPPIGFVQDYPHIQYNTGDAEDLRRVLRELVERRQRLRRTVAHRTWQAWAEDHDRLFRQLLRDGCPSAFNVSTVPARKNEHLRVLLATHAPENVTRGGPSIRVGKTAEELRKLGLLVDIVAEARPDPTGYDLVHVFNVWEPQAALEQLRHLRQFDVPIAFSPIYLDLSETAWTGRAVPRLFRQSDSPEVLKRYLDALADDSLLLDGSGRPEVLEIEPGYFASVKELVNLADHLIALGEREMRKLWATGVEPRPYTLVRNATEFDRFAKASAEPFVARYGVKDYVLCVGRLEHRKNQLLLVQALKDTGLPLVLVGQSLDPHYAELVRRHAESTVLFIDHLPHENDLLASAYAGARVFALPSWSEGAPLAALEAAAAGTALVLSNRSSEQEYFGDLARYCDPSSVESIRETVLEAYHKDARNKARRRRLQTLVRSQYTWGKAAKDTLAAYHRTLEQRARHAMPLPDVHPESVRRLEIGSGNTPQPGYEHLDIRSDLPHLEHVHDIAKPLPFPEATFDEILSRSSLEHVSWRHITEILRDWRRVLKPGGVLRIWMPDLEYLARTYLSGTTDQHLDPSYVSEAQRLL
ncbi:MAG: glycosyltransferase, partial [Chloroflexota bacterium]